jgi:E3 ubiquitin-protein ligase RNF115/126
MHPVARLLHEMLGIVPMNLANHDNMYADERWDDIITSLMGQDQTGGGAPPARQADIDALPQIELNESMLDEKGNAECVICKEDVVVTVLVTKLPCGHWFHKECIEVWLKEHDSCPVCRVKLNSVVPVAPDLPSRQSSRGSRVFRRNSTQDGPSRSRSFANPRTWFGRGDGGNEGNGDTN